jgi:hypothetical protein
MDFEQAPPMLPVFYGVLQGTSHIGPFGGEPRAGQYGRAGVAWLRWQLASDPMFASWFTGTDCTLCESPVRVTVDGEATQLELLIRWFDASTS